MTTTDRLVLWAALLGLAFGLGHWTGNVRAVNAQARGLTQAEYVAAQVHALDRDVRAELARCREAKP